jgi:hypothetical protein
VTLGQTTAACDMDTSDHVAELAAHLPASLRTGFAVYVAAPISGTRGACAIEYLVPLWPQACWEP